MSIRAFDLSKMTIEDLFRAKKERRQRLAQLPFEQKIEIVKKLQGVSRVVRAEIREDQTWRKGESDRTLNKKKG